MPLFNDTITLGVRADLTQFERDILSATSKANSRIKPITLRINNQASQPLGKITGDISQFNKSLDAATARVLAFSANIAIINGVVGGFRSLVKETIAVEKALTDINVVLNTSQKGLADFSNSLFDIARNTSSSFKAVTEAALEFSRQGLSVEETLKRTNSALVLSRISGLDAAEAVKTLTTAMNGFNKEALDHETVINRLANVDSNFAVSTKDLAEALTRVGSTASEANVQFNELIATVTAVQQTTSRGGAVIGNALKTIFTRLSREGTVQQLKELGVAIDESQNGIEKLRAVAAAVKNVDKSTANTIKELAGGVFQINTVTAALSDLNKGYSVYDNALRVANSTTDAAIRRNEELNKTLAALTQQAGTNIDELFAKIGKISLSGNLKTIFGQFNSLTKGISDSLDGEGLGAKLGQGILTGIGNFLTGPAAIVALGAFTKLIASVGKDAFAAFRSTAGITTEADKQATLQKAIEQRLTANAALYERQLLSGKNLVGIQRQILADLTSEAQLRAAIGKITPQFAAASSPFLNVKGGRITPKAAEGYFPAMLQEQAAVNNRVGGASPSSEAVYVPRFNYGDKTGPIVVNTSEKIVENWMGGKGSAVLNPDMIAALGGEDKLSLYGKVKNVAEGLVPNFIRPFFKGSRILGEGLTGRAFINDSLNKKLLESESPEVIFKKFKTEIHPNTSKLIEDEYSQSKMAEALGLPVARTFGSLDRAKSRGGIFKELIGGVGGNDFLKILKGSEKEDFRNALESTFNQKGVRVNDLHGDNYKIQDSIDDLRTLYNAQGYAGVKERALSKVKVIDIGLKGAAGGYFPNLAENPLKESVTREVISLVKQGYPLSAAKESVRVDRDKALVAPHNPLGFGVFNTLQGQTSLRKAFTDHGGQNLKTAGAAGGYAPNLAITSQDALSLGGAALRPGGVEGLIKSLDVSNINFDISKRALRKKIQRLIEEATDVDIGKLKGPPKKAYAKLIDEVLEVRAPEFKALEQKHIAERNATTPSSVPELTREQIEARFKATQTQSSGTSSLAGDFFNKVAKAKNANKAGLNADLAADIFESAQAKINKRGLFSTQTVGSILKSEAGFGTLNQKEQGSLKKLLQDPAAANRRQSFDRASLGISLAGSLASPFIDQAAESLRPKNGQGASVASAGLSTASGALTGASFGAIFGPVGLGVGALAGGLLSLTKALDGSESRASDLTKTLDEMSSKNSAIVNGFGSFIQTQQKLNGIIEEGGKASDIAAVRQELSRVFSSISDPEVRKNILATSGSVETLSEAFAKAQAKGFSDTKRQEAVTVAAQERAKNTNFLGGRSQSTFAPAAISEIGRSLVASASPEKLKSFAESIKDLDGTVSKSTFQDKLKEIGVAADDAGSIFDSLEQPLNRLLLLRDLKKEIDISKELEEATAATVRYKKSLTDLNRTISVLTALDTSDKKTGLGIQANAFGVQQNRAQNAAGLKFFNAGQFAQAQISTAFQSSQVRFNAGQERESTRLDAASQIADFLTQNRQQLKTDKVLVDKLDAFVAGRGQGDVSSLTSDFVRKGTGSGEDLKAFSQVAVTFNELRNKLASIDDNEKSQLTILRDTLAAQKERIQIENKVGLLGGAEGQINFATSGLERFGNRAANSSLAGLGGQVGAFGRNENAQGVLDFQKTFGGVDGLDVRSLIPNAEQLVADSIKKSLIEGFSRLDVPIDSDKLKQIDSISQLSAAKQFEKKELTAIEIGDAVSASFKYDVMSAGTERAFGSALGSAKITEYTSAVPEIRNFLTARFGLEKQRLDLNDKATAKTGEISKNLSQIANLQSDINLAKANGTGTLKVPNRNISLFNDKTLLAASAADRAAAERIPGGDVRNLPQSTVLQSAFVASQQIKNLIPDDGDTKKFRNNINDAVNSNSNTFLKTALLQQFDGGFGEKNGKRTVTDETFAKIITALEKAGGVQFDASTQQRIGDDTGKIAELQEKLKPLQDEFAQLSSNIASLNKQIESTTLGAATPLNSSNASGAAAGRSIPAIDLSAGFFKRFVASQPKNNAEEVAKIDAEKIERRQNLIRFGPIDTNTIGALQQARQNLKEGGPNENIEKLIRSLETTLLRQAQTQQFTIGKANPELAKVTSVGTLRQNSLKISNNDAAATFDDLADQAREAFISGFADKSEMSKLGIKISQTLEQYVRAQVKLGVPEDEAIKAGKILRAKIQGQLDQIDVKLPKNKIAEFGQGFKGRVGELQKSFDDLSQVGENTADSLVNGFGDAFFEIASGAQDAQTAVRSLLSSIAADLSKFFFKRAIGTALGKALGTGAGGGGFAQGGIVKLANGGSARGVPALVMGGERVFGPDVVKAYGPDFFHDLNAGKIQAPKIANGGELKGGSGYKDDLFHTFPEGSFVLQKSAVNKYGKDYLDSVASGPKMAQGGVVQRAFWGALLGSIFSKAVQGAVVGAATAKITGGDWKKGALYGGIAGGIAGGVGGYGAAKGASGSFGSQFGNSFSGGFGYLGLGKQDSTVGANGTAGSGIASADSLSAAKGPSDMSFNEHLDKLNTGPLLSQVSGGNATGLGNQSLTANATATKTNAYKNAAKSFGTGLVLALASSALAPKQASNDSGSTTIKGSGAITTYNPDGSVAINTAGGTKVIRRNEYNSTTQLEQLITRNGGNLPTDGVPHYATGGEVASGAGSIMVKDKSFTRPINPYVSMGSGTKDDQKALLKKGEFILNDRATEHFGVGLLNRMNSLGVSRDDISSRRNGGILAMERGGAVEYNPSDRDRGTFSVDGPSKDGAASRSSGNTNVNITVNMNGAGADVTVSKSGTNKEDDKNSVDSQRFANKVKMMFLELLDAEKRPGGSLSGDNR